MNRSFRIIFPLIICTVVLALLGCQSEVDTSGNAAKAGGKTLERAGAPPIPDSLSPEMKQRIAQEQAQFRARSQQQQQQAQTPSIKPGSPK